MTSKDGPGPMTREAFAQAGLAIVDESGLEALTTRALGERLGVHGTAVYRHFANMDELREAVLAEMLMVWGVEVPDVGSPRERMLGLLRSLRRAFSEHPNLAIPNLTMQDEQATVEFVKAAFDVLEAMGLSGRQLVVAYQMLKTFTVATNAYDWGGYPDALEARRRGRRLSGHPAFEAPSRSLEAMQELNEEVFEVMANALLDACEAMATK